MTDISPSLYKTIKDAFDKSVASNKTIQGILEKLGSNSAKINHGESYKYAEEIGTALADAFQKNLSSEILPDGKMYFNIAKAVVEPLLKANSNLAEAVAADVQTKLNQTAGIGIKAIKPGVNQDKIDGIINRLANEEVFDDVKWILNEPVINFTESAVDDTIKTNVEIQGESGLKPKIRRITIGKCCDWCEELAGTYDYDDAPEDIYRRHEFCRCIVEVDVGDGKLQDAWDKKIRSQEESQKRINEKLEALEKQDKTKHQDLQAQILIDEQVSLIKKYGSVENMMLFGGADDVSRYMELSKLTNLSQEDVKQILIKDTDSWGTLLAQQNESLRGRLTKYAERTFDDTEKSAFRSWTSPMYSEINRYEKYGINVPKPAQEVAKQLESALNKATTSEDMFVKRGVTRHTLEYMFADVKGVDGWESDLSKLIGHTYTDNGFVATSPFSSGGFGGGVTIYMNVPEGTHAAYIESFSHADNEKELLIQKGYSYDILNIKEVPNKYFPEDKDIVMWVNVRR